MRVFMCYLRNEGEQEGQGQATRTGEEDQLLEGDGVQHVNINDVNKRSRTCFDTIHHANKKKELCMKYVCTECTVRARHIYVNPTHRE